MVNGSKRLNKVARRQRTDRTLGVIAIVTILIAWILGSQRARGDLMPAIYSAMPEAEYLEQINDDLYVAYADAGKETLLGYVALGESSGYGGPLLVAVAVNTTGDTIGMTIASHKETPAWMKIVLNTNLLGSLIDKPYSDNFVVGEDVDSITGATYTARAIAESVLSASHAVAEHIGLPVTPPPKPKIVFGLPEIVLVGLFAAGYFGHQRTFRYKKLIRWVTILVGLIVLGVMYNSPLTLSYINKFLLGFWPEWQTHIYWYLLIGGILFVFTVDNKNPYCEWFCPFGAAQECLGVIGGAKLRSEGRYKDLLIWVQRGLAWLAIVLALYFRNPGITSFEVFGTLFDLTGSSLQFGLLGIIMIASLFIKRPWCKYLCPLRPVMDLYRTFRKWVMESWKRLRARAAG
jgi:Na+-translocating ferredoxin:NAD+ oxidoreductase RnfG subunit